MTYTVAQCQTALRAVDYLINGETKSFTADQLVEMLLCYLAATSEARIVSNGDALADIDAGVDEMPGA